MERKLSLIAYLARLPHGYRELALKNYANQISSRKIRFAKSSAEAVHSGFVWGKTPQGHDFWRTVYIAISEPTKYELPPLP